MPRPYTVPRHWMGLQPLSGPGDYVQKFAPHTPAVLPGPTALASQLKKGMPTLVVLATLAAGEQYGYGLRRATWVSTRGLFPLNEGGLYAVLARLQHRRLVTSRRETVGGRHRRYYALTPRGRAVLAETRVQWRQLRETLDRLLS